MSRIPWTSLGALALGIRLALAAHPTLAAPVESAPVQPAERATVYVYAFVDQTPTAGVSVAAASATTVATDARGVASLVFAPGANDLTITRAGTAPIVVPLTVVAGEQVQLTVSWYAQRAPVYSIRSSVSGERTVDLATAATSPVAEAGATEPPFDASLDAPETDAGNESAPRRQPRETSLSGIEVEGEVLRTDDQAAYTDEKRATAQVTEALSAEQIARAGDTDTAQALKRVTGLTLVDSRFVYVRGLGERYSSVLLNGAQVPSPDPTRRVVPLDLFPTEILDGIVVQKTYSPEMPGDFGGGTIQLRTKSYPDDFFIKVTGKLGWVDGTTGDDGLVYDGGNRDWTGHDDGTRELPDDLRRATAGGRFLRERTPLVPDGATPQEIEQYGESLVQSGFSVNEESIDPDTGFSVALGDRFDVNDDVKFGYLAAFRYSNEWDSTREKFASYTPTSAGLERTNFGDIDKTEQEINVSGFIATGIDIGPDHHLSTATTLLRQTTDEARVFEGRDDSVMTRTTNLRWIENSLVAHQVGGEHRFEALHDLGLDWQYTDARARRYAPAERRYRFDLDESGANDGYLFSSRSDNLGYNFSNLDDDSEQIQATLKLPLTFGENAIDLSFGIDRLDRDRDAQIRRYAFQSPQPGGIVSPETLLLPSLEQIFTPGTIDPLGFRLIENTRQSDNYFASQALDAEFVNAELRLGEKYRLSIGARHERNEQRVTTYSITSATQDPVVADLDESDVLPSAAFTWILDDRSQIRAAYAETRNRPDFRELSPAPFTDPEQDAETLGNPGLETAELKHFDLRYEYYFDGVDLVSIAYFRKEFDRPIELLRLPFLSPLLTLANAESATNQGIELDAYKHLGFVEDWSAWDALKRIPWSDLHVGFNYAYIDSEVELDPATSIGQTNQKRPLQGQSPYVVNLQLGYTEPENRSQWTLLYNRFGKRIAQVGVDGAPDIYEQPFDQLDFQYEHAIGESWRWKLRLRNLLDPKVAYHQGGEDTRTYRRGREIALILEWLPDFAK